MGYSEGKPVWDRKMLFFNHREWGLYFQTRLKSKEQENNKLHESKALACKLVSTVIKIAFNQIHEFVRIIGAKVPEVV